MKRKKYVYILEVSWAYEGYEVIGVFGTKKKAEKEKTRIEKMNIDHEKECENKPFWEVERPKPRLLRDDVLEINKWEIGTSVAGGFSK